MRSNRSTRVVFACEHPARAWALLQTRCRCSLRAPARWGGRTDLRRANGTLPVAAARDLLAGLPGARDRELFFGEDRAAEARVGRELEVRRLAERAVRAHLDAVAAVDAAHDIELVGLQIALAHHQGPGRARLPPGAARDAVGIGQRDVPRRRDDRVVARAQEAVAVRADDAAADPHALR